MPGKFSKNNPLGDIVPIEGAFVSTFLHSMPPIYVKIYLYLIYLCNHNEIKADNIANVARALEITSSELDAGMQYLSGKHLINYTLVPFAFEVLSATEASTTENKYAADSLTAYSDYFAGIRSLFPNRNISNSEYDKAKDWVEIYGLSIEAALLLIAHCVESKDSAISFSYIDKVALSWANDGITTNEAAEEFISIYEARHHDAAKLLQYMGIKRTPSVDEMKMYGKWMDMGFDLSAIKTACSETTKIQSPNFAYVNRILEKLHSLGLINSREIKSYIAESNSDRRLISAILASLGERSKTITDYQTEKLNEFKQAGFAEDVLIHVARLVCESGNHTFGKYVAVLEMLNGKKLYKSAEITLDSVSVHSDSKKSAAKADFENRKDGYGEEIYADASNLEV